MLWLLAAVQLCWVAPTQNVDGTPLTDLDAFRVYYGPEPRAYTSTLDLPDETQTCHAFSVTPGPHYFAMTAIDADGNESAYSNEVLRTEVGPPQPPVILSQAETVYTVVRQPNRFVLLAVGTVPAGTVCDPSQTVNGHGAVPVDAVEWSSGTTVRPVVVVARCG